MADLEALPPSMKGELIDGVLYAMSSQQQECASYSQGLPIAFYAKSPPGRGRGGCKGMGHSITYPQTHPHPLFYRLGGVGAIAGRIN